MGNTDPENIFTEEEQVESKEDVPSAAIPTSVNPEELKRAVLEEQAKTNAVARDVGKLEVALEIHETSENLLGSYIILENSFSKLLHLVYSAPSKTSVSKVNISRAFERLFTSKEERHQAKKNAIFAALKVNEVNLEIFVQRLWEIFDVASGFVQCYKTIDDKESSIETLAFYAPKLSKNDLLYIDILTQSI